MAIESVPAASRLYKDALSQFKRETEAHYYDSTKKLELLREFLAQRGSPEEAKAAAGSLRTDAGKKYGSKKVGDAEIPDAWIGKIMGNIGTFVEVGNYAMTGAPESVGLAWFAVKLTLSAIQSNYELYSLFGSGLTDISEIMIMIPHYDRLYDEKSKANTDWKPSPVVEKLFQDIIATYAAVLRFSFSIKRHLSAGTLTKLRHGFKDFFGTSKEKFQAELSLIGTLKTKILEESQAIFQDKSLHHLESVKGIVSNIESTVNEIKSFQATLREMHEAQTAQWEVMLKKMDDIKATTKPKTPWDIALQDFEKNKDLLNPLKDTSGALGDAIDQRHPGTCAWIFEQSAYSQWTVSTESELLCLSGQQGSGKSILLASVVERLGDQKDEDSTLLYISCGATRSGATSREAPTVDQVCHTLLYQLYSIAREDESRVKLLEDCNKVFTNPKAKSSKIVPTRGNKDGNLADFEDAFSTIAELLKLRIVVAIDKVHNLSPSDQEELASKLKTILLENEKSISVKFLIGCRSATKFHNKLGFEGGITSIDVGDFNDDDMAKKVFEDLQRVPGLSESERKEATEAIITKAGPRFAYIDNIAIPFMREPFQRPISRRLQALPENMNNLYNDAIHKMGSNYVDLLRTALTMTLLAPNRPKVEEILDVYHLTYNDRGPEIEAQARALDVDQDEHRFSPPSDLDIAQLRDASGPFLRVEQQNGEYYVTLQDPARVREFCLHASHEDENEHQNHELVCTRCKSDLQQSKTLSISEKDAHLEMALICVRAMNNPIFQRRSTADEPVPLWSYPEGAEDTADKSQDDNVNAAGDEDVASGTEVATAGEVNATEEKENAKEDESAVDGAQPQETNGGDGDDKASDSGTDADESVDDEDRGDVSFVPTVAVQTQEEYSNSQSEVRNLRYENIFWSKHMIKAEELWTAEERKNDAKWAELYDELNYLITHNSDYFHAWQTLPEYDYRTPYHSKLKPLHLAARVGTVSWAEHLLANGADIHEQSGAPFPKTPIQLTAWNGDRIPMLKLLLEQGADPNFGTEETLPAFHEWMYEDPSIEVVRLFLEYGADPTMVNVITKWNILGHYAIRGEDPEVLDLLLKETPDGKKADINYCEYSAPLHLLLERPSVPKALLEGYIKHGADINKDDFTSTRPLQMATRYGELSTLQTLCKGQSIEQIDDDDEAGYSALHQAAVGGHPKCLALLAEMGANVNLPTKTGRVALHSAVWESGVKECVEILLSHGADPNPFDKHNRNALLFACLGESEEIAEFLLDELLKKETPIAQINAKTKRHRTPLRQAAGHGFDTIVNKLIKAAQAANDLEGLAINEADTRKGMTALHRAAWFGKKESVRLLLEADADASLQDHNGKTALVLAYEQWARASQQQAFEDIISRLIDKDPASAKSDPELVAICAINGSLHLLKKLVAIGSDLNKPDQYGWTPLDLARKFHQVEAGEFLNQQAAWRGMLPSRWADDTRTTITEEGKVVSHSSKERICISADKPLPAGLDSFYFEVTSKEVAEGSVRAEMAIGFCTIGGSAISFPGWLPRPNAPSALSWGYHGDDGGLYMSTNDSPYPLSQDVGYGAGDTLGCGADLTTRKIWFTRNGVKLDFTFDHVQGRLFPLLGLVDDVHLETNFTGPFLWKGDDVETAALGSEHKDSAGESEG